MIEEAKILKEVRRRTGITQGDLSMRSGIHRSSISMYERGTSGVGLYNFQCLLEAMGYELKVVPKK